MDRLYMYVVPAGRECSEPVYTILSTSAILGSSWWPDWKQKMEAMGRFMGDSIEFMQDKCVADFCIEHWAVEVDAELCGKYIFRANRTNSETN